METTGNSPQNRLSESTLGSATQPPTLVSPPGGTAGPCPFAGLRLAASGKLQPHGPGSCPRMDTKSPGLPSLQKEHTQSWTHLQNLCCLLCTSPVVLHPSPHLSPRGTGYLFIPPPRTWCPRHLCFTNEKLMLRKLDQLSEDVTPCVRKHQSKDHTPRPPQTNASAPVSCDTILTTQ